MSAKHYVIVGAMMAFFGIFLCSVNPGVAFGHDVGMVSTSACSAIGDVTQLAGCAFSPTSIHALLVVVLGLLLFGVVRSAGVIIGRSPPPGLWRILVRVFYDTRFRQFGIFRQYASAIVDPQVYVR